MLDIDDEAKSLAEKIIFRRAVPSEYPEDTLHIAETKGLLSRT